MAIWKDPTPAKAEPARFDAPPPGELPVTMPTANAAPAYAATDATANIAMMILQASNNPDIDVDKIEKMYQLYNAEAERLAELEFSNALVTMQGEISPIATDAQFTPKAVETKNERAKLMFKIRLKVPAETALKYRGLLKGGMTGNGYVRMDEQAPWPADLAVKLPQ